MAILRLAICVSGVYATFLLWAIAQERLVSVPFPSKEHPVRLQPPPPEGQKDGDIFPSPLFLHFVQAIASAISAISYLFFNAWRDGTLKTRSVATIIGWNQVVSSVRDARTIPSITNTPKMIETEKMERLQLGHQYTKLKAEKAADDKLEKRLEWRRTLPALVCQVAAFQTMAGPIGFAALRRISYPTMVLGKSCKLIPVMLMNIVLYRRRFSMHKYLVVALVTVGISLFMLYGEKKKKVESNSVTGLTLLIINLLFDGLTNSTQDQIFSNYPSFTGQQMMLAMAILTQVILLPFLMLPMPLQASSFAPLVGSLRSNASSGPLLLSPPAMSESIHFLYTHPTAVSPLITFALLGGLGQLFIFETIQHFGSLTLVMVTVTRKLFTMLLSVIVFEHKLTDGQWLGVAVVFGGIGIEAIIKRREMMRRARRG